MSAFRVFNPLGVFSALGNIISVSPTISIVVEDPQCTNSIPHTNHDIPQYTYGIPQCTAHALYRVKKTPVIVGLKVKHGIIISAVFDIKQTK